MPLSSLPFAIALPELRGKSSTDLSAQPCTKGLKMRYVHELMEEEYCTRVGGEGKQSLKHSFILLDQVQ